jgi:UDP:flavonoid glycosyltransferase YjiC (YdhE family)
MRLLVSIRPYFGHLHPHVPLASTLVRRGHSVTFATAASFCPVVLEAGFECSAAGLHPNDPLPPEHEGKPYARDYGMFPVKAKCADLVALASGGLNPDVIIRDPTDVAAVVAAEVLRIPCVTLGFCEFIPPSSWDILLGPALDEVRSHWNVNGDPHWERMHPAGYFNLVPEPFHEERAVIPGERSLRPVCKQAYETPPPVAWLAELPTRPTIHVTLGTAFNFHTQLMANLVNWLSQLPISVICTTGPAADRQPLDALSDRHNVYLTDYLPLELILPRCDAVITAGGFNTVMGALQFGLPMLVIPLGADQPWNARRVAGLGAGVSLEAAAADRDTVTTVARDLIVEPSYRVVAARLQERIERMPGPDEAAAYLESICG